MMFLKMIVLNTPNIVNLHTSLCTRWLFIIRNHQCMVINRLKINARLCDLFLNRYIPGETFIVCCLVIVLSLHVRSDMYSSI